jgi:hypothetical protein
MSNSDNISEGDYTYDGDGFTIFYDVITHPGPGGYDEALINSVRVDDLKLFEEAYGDIAAKTFASSPQGWAEMEFIRDDAGFHLVDAAGFFDRDLG